MNHARKSTWEMLCRDRDLQAINAKKQQFGGMMDAEINNIIYMELYSGPKMAHGKYGNLNVVGSIDRDSTVHCRDMNRFNVAELLLCAGVLYLL
jgi:hypothetical protein